MIQDLSGRTPSLNPLNPPLILNTGIRIAGSARALIYRSPVSRTLPWAVRQTLSGPDLPPPFPLRRHNPCLTTIFVRSTNQVGTANLTQPSFRVRLAESLDLMALHHLSHPPAPIDLTAVASLPHVLASPLAPPWPRNTSPRLKRSPTTPTTLSLTSNVMRRPLLTPRQLP